MGALSLTTIGFVVAASRARLAFFIVGSSGAVRTGNGGTIVKHWSKLLDGLGTPRMFDNQPAAALEGASTGGGGGGGGFLGRGKGGNDSNLVSAAALSSGPRVGSGIPLYCPRHRSSAKVVKCPADFPTESNWSSFCSLPCAFCLDWCGHACSLTCHSPSRKPHTTPGACEQLLARPCLDHAAVPLTCGDLFSSAFPAGILQPGSSQGPDHIEALQNYRCDQKVKFYRPECGHELDMQCFERLDLYMSGGKGLSPCVEVVGDFVHPQCNHVIKRPKCADRRNFEKNPPRCLENVALIKNCGCEVKMECWKAVEEQRNPSICNRGRDCLRPRCSHRLSMRCFQVTELNSRWQDQGGGQLLPLLATRRRRSWSMECTTALPKAISWLT